ncbi:MAG TPA: glycosyltransferase family 4 protein [Candidatus Obscuribacterales bacterium]
MRIAQLAPLVEPVPPRGYGGTELVVSLLTEELVARGHEVTLFASGDSQTSARLLPIVPEALRRQDIPERRWAAYDIRSLLKLEELAGQFDVVHNHMGWQALPALRGLSVPAVTTNHNPVKDYCAPIYLACGSLPYVSISNAYRRVNYPDRLNYVATVYNGIDIEQFDAAADSARSFLLFLGRVCPDKGTAEAIRIAKAVGLPLKIAGKLDVNDRPYFESSVKPHFSPRQVEYLGEVDHEGKVDLYRHAIAVLNPINFEEPFGLVMAEALACGTPVVALNRGSVSEVLSDGETAVVGNSVDELIRRFPEIEKIRADACKRRARALFSKQKMADGYERVYRNLTERP